MRAWLKKRAIFIIMIWVSSMGTGTSLAQHNPSSNHGAVPVQSDEMVVTAKRIQDYINNHPQQVSVMTRDQIKHGSYTDLNQVLNAMPGVEVKKSGSGFGSRISIRGSGTSGKILVLINGRPVNSTQYGVVDLDSIPLDMVSRVDVFKPPVPVWLGPGGTAGAINIVLANPAPKDREEQKNSHIGIIGGSFGKAGLTLSQLMAIKSHQLGLVASGDHLDGSRTNSDSDSGSMSFQWDLPSKENTTYDINGRYFQSEHGSPGPTYNRTPDARQSYQKSGFDFRMQDFFGETGDYDLKTYLDFTRLEDESQSGMVSTLDALTFGVKNETSWSADDNRWALRLSGNLAQDRIKHTLSGDHNRENVSLGLQGDKNFDYLTATLGTRCDYTSDFGFQPAATSGLSINLNSRNHAKINAGYGVIVPTFGQLYQPSHGSIDQVRGNPDLKEESVLTVAAGINHLFSDKRSVEITLFREDTDDKIVYQEGADLIMRPINIDGAYRQGIETVVNWKLVSSASFILSCLCQQSRNLDNDKELTYTPEHKVKLTLNWTLPTKTRTETTVTSIGSCYSDLENTSEKKVDGYTTVDLKIIQPVGFPKCQTEFFVYFENLLDEAYEIHYGYPDDGFRVTAGLNIDF
jgi:vitamin B12 transporter